MNKPYGFKIIADKEREFKFTARDWGLLTAYDEFGQMSGIFRRTIGLDALEFMIGKKKYPVQITRSKRFFLQYSSHVSELFTQEKEDLRTDFKVLIPGYSDPLRNVHCKYMGFSAIATGKQGFCTLRAYDGASKGTSREIIKVDLRRFKEFPVDDDQMIRLRKKKRESSIKDTFSRIIKFVDSKSVGNTFKIELTGGDT